MIRERFLCSGDDPSLMTAKLISDMKISGSEL